MTILRKNNAAMISRLRRKFVMTAMGALLIILVLLLGFINVFYLMEVNSDTRTMLQLLLDNGGVFPVEQFMPDMPEIPDGQSGAGGPGQPPNIFAAYRDAYRVEAPFETRYFSVLVSEDRVDSVDLEHIAAITEDQAHRYAEQIVSDGHDHGYYGAYQYGIQEHEDGSVLVVFIDCSSRFSSALQLFEITLSIGAVALLLMMVIVYLLSGLAVAPAVESLEKQKRFISDASHELKTPLAVISANVDVLEMDGDQNEWTRSIRNQVRRMTDLLNNMLTLSRLEEHDTHELFADVDLSQCMQESADTFLVVARARGKEYRVEIPKGIHMQGDRKALLQLSSILIDNALKYSNVEGNILVQLKRDEKNIAYSVTNTCDSLPEGDLNRLFDRFYRADSSRSRGSGGYGIGLSVAKAICENHDGTISVQRESGGRVCFMAKFPAGRVATAKRQQTHVSS